jgi:hypothetical protein
LTSNDGGPADFAVPFNAYKSLWIKDVYARGANGTLTTLNNSFTQGDASLSVPGPLPVMGAGVAFGFTRRLRRRIKANPTQA